MADFTGMTVQVTLRQPPNTILHGRVKEVVAGQTLSLQDVFFPATGTRWDQWTVQGSVIADLQVIDAVSASTPTSAIRTNAPQLPQIPQQQQQQQQLPQQIPQIHQQQIPHRPIKSQHPQGPPGGFASPVPAPSPQRQSSNFVDPAILSFTRNSPAPVPYQQRAAPKSNGAPNTPVKPMFAKAAEALPSPGPRSPFLGEPKNVDIPKPAAVAPAVEAGAQDGAAGDYVQDANGKRRKRQQKQKNKQQDSTPHAPPPVMNSEVSRNGNDMQGSVRRGKGWRQTPLLQPSPAPSADKQGSARKSRRQFQEEKEAQNNGWATEDATDIQDMGEFDFEANHKLFDKKQVFEELRQGDTTADEDRLVSHNKVHRPGTYGGRNLHPTENVLSPKLEELSSDADTEMNFNTGRSSSRHSATKKQPTRQNSAVLDTKPHPFATSVSSERGPARAAASFAGRGGKALASVVASSPRPDRIQSPHSVVSSSKTNGHPVDPNAPEGPHFMIMPSRKACPVLHPSALDTLEQETISRYGLTVDAITETAARSIAEQAFSLIDSDSSSRRGSRANTLRASMSRASMSNSANLSTTSKPPVIVILAGNHTLGARAVAAARHLIGRNTHIILAEAVYAFPPAHQDDQLTKQITILKKVTLRGNSRIKRGPWRKAFAYIKKLSSPPAVIIDALLGGETYDSLLALPSTDSAGIQAEVREIIDWANRSRAPKLSLGCPSGVSGLDGTATIVEGEPLAVRPEKVFALGAPMLGLLEAVKGGERWEVVLGDIGINVALRLEEAVGFGGAWNVHLQFVEGLEVKSEGSG